MAFLLQDGALYMPLKRANEVWDTLISNSNACQEDRRVRSCPLAGIKLSDMMHLSKVVDGNLVFELLAKGQSILQYIV